MIDFNVPQLSGTDLKRAAALLGKRRMRFESDRRLRARLTRFYCRFDGSVSSVRNAVAEALDVLPRRVRVDVDRGHGEATATVHAFCSAPTLAAAERDATECVPVHVVLRVVRAPWFQCAWSAVADRVRELLARNERAANLVPKASAKTRAPNRQRRAG